jgi:hypothetical protein
MRAFLLLSLIAIIPIFIYATMNGHLNHMDRVGFLPKFSFGNVGFPEAICSKALLRSNEKFVDLNLRCQGSTVISEVYASGMFSTDAEHEIINYCEIPSY